MKTRIMPYERAHEASVAAMNARLKEGGTHWGFYHRAVPSWLAHDREGQPVSRLFFVAVGEDQEVHGGFCFKEQLFLIKGEPMRLGTWQGPVSEGLVDRRFRKVGMQCLSAIRDRNPLLFAWGGSPQINAVLSALGWAHFGTPLVMKMIRPARVVRVAPFLRTNKRVAKLAPLAAASGAATLGVRALQFATAVRAGRPRPARGTIVASFGDWSDRIWEAAKGSYGVIAARDAESLTLLMGRPGWPDARILRVDGDSGPIGWAALRVNQMQGDARFGDLKLGSIIDALSLPGQEGVVTATAARALEQEGVDLIAGNLTHRVWRKAFAAAGFLLFANRRDYYLPAPTQALFEERGIHPVDDFHLMPIDGDGPMGF